MRKSVRLAVPAITASAVMLLGACSSDSDSDSEDGGGNPLEQSESTGGSGSEEGSDAEGGSGSETGSGGGGGEVPADADVEGGWNNMEQGLGLYVTQGTFSVANADGSVSCTGQYSEGDLTGQCQDGSDFSGTATLNDDDTLNVQLNTGEVYDFTRAGDMELPEMPEVPDM